VEEELFTLLYHLSSHPAFVRIVLLNLLVFCVDLSFFRLTILPTVQLHVSDKPLNFLTNAGGELRWYRRVNSSSSTSGTRRVAFATNPAFSHQSEKDRIVITTNGTHPYSFVKDSR
jgi:hypothetical protein